MALRKRIDYPTNVADTATRDYLANVADVLNQLPNISIISEVSGPEGVTRGNYGDLAVNVASAAGELHIKSSGLESTTKWTELGSTLGYGVCIGNDVGIQTIPSGTTSILTCWDVQVLRGSVSRYSHPAYTPDIAGFTVTSAGTYMFALSSSFTADVSIEIAAALYKNDSITSYRFHRTLGTALQAGSASFVGGIIKAAANDVFTVRCSHDNVATKSVSIIDAQLYVTQLE